jgi:hypothetical protein
MTITTPALTDELAVMTTPAPADEIMPARNIRCYKYRAWPASRADADLLHAQARLGGDYRRMLVDIDNLKRALLRALWAEPMRDIPFEDRKAWRETGGGDAVLKAWCSTEGYKGWRAAIQTAAIVANKAAYAAIGERGLAWGTRLAVGEAVEHAARTTKWENDLGHAPNNRVAVQIQGSTDPDRLLDDTHRASLLSCEQLIGGDDTRLRIGADLYALGDRINGYRIRAVGRAVNLGGNVRPARMRQASIRVGSDGRTPIWASLHVLMHRSLPDGYVKGAWAQCRQIGGRWEWEIVLSIDITATRSFGNAVVAGMIGRAAAVHPRPGSTVGVDVGWRRRSDGMRVAYWLGSDGAEGEVVIPIAVERRKSKSDDLRSIRDNLRNALAADLRAWVESHRGTWLDEALEHATQWTRIRHFVRLEQTWSNQRVAEDWDMYDALVAFLKQDRHLHMWEANNHVRMQRQIRGQLNVWAHEMCARYAVLAIEKLDMTELKELPDKARINSRAIQRLAPSEVHIALKAAAPRYGSIVHVLEAALTTKRCAQCSHVRVINDQSVLVLACEVCGLAEDQDRTAARNLVRASETERDADGKPLASGSMRVTKKLAPRRTRKRKAAQVIAPASPA